ncbi:3-dehydroquinate synthase [Temperatibacter marinus]|uniref:3-dehydroquinate synthase n=1 Tax=Temperatibacter marinus TaxID=1456591 RepID=A0AA52HA74_9PROT|nr:3-dehydroquinate synthase [Temperatibacter marinus]WND03951.1 3-dehydroquinate synthase [Temperatibacter marinus]
MPAEILERVFVDLADRSYTISIGSDLIPSFAELASDHLQSDRLFIITDENVAPHYLSPLLESCAAAHLHVETVILPAGEQTKSFSQYESLINRLLSYKPSRKDCLVALGGGVIGDLVGYVASSLLRGLPFIQVPTTLLSQVDSSVGGKTGINTKYGKNLVGAFYQPEAVFIDINSLSTLPARETLAGYAEVVKYGLINDETFFSWLEENGPSLLKGDKDLMAQAISKSCQSKAQVVSEDEREGGKRALLNLGHTFGHAIEAACGYDGTLLHGEGVSIGMCLAFEASVHLGLCPQEEADRVARHLKACGMMTRAADVPHTLEADTLVNNMAQDKKIEAGEIVFVLAEGIGKSLLVKGPDSQIIKTTIMRSLKA